MRRIIQFMLAAEEEICSTAVYTLALHSVHHFELVAFQIKKSEKDKEKK